MPDSIQADLLRQWRLAKQLDISIVARQANLSIRQIRQLEEGGDSCFYSRAIKENAARKVAQVLGGDPDQVVNTIAMLTPESSSVQEQASLVDGLIELQKPADKIQFKAPWRMKQMVGATAVLVTAILALSSVDKQQASESVLPDMQKTLQFSDDPTAKKPSLTDGPAPIAASANTAESSSSPASASAFTVASVELPETVTASEFKPASALCQQSLQGPTLTPKIPTKPGDMVYIVAQKSGSVCVQDGSGKTTLLSLPAQAAKSVYGLAPWRLYFEHAAQVELYFQGERLQMPDQNVLTVALQESAKAH